MCTRDKEFTIRGTEDCLARGYDRTGFFEVDTGEQRSWTVQLTDTAEQGPARTSLRTGRTARRWCRRGRAGRRRLRRAPEGAEEMRRLRRTKIVATLGPASSSPEMIGSLFEAGADVFRINMSHTSHDRMRELVAHDPRRRARHTTGRSASWSICRAPSCASARSRAARRCVDDRRRPSCSTPIRRRATRRACTCRIRRSSPASSPATRC